MLKIFSHTVYRLPINAAELQALSSWPLALGSIKNENEDENENRYSR